MQSRKNAGLRFGLAVLTHLAKMPVVGKDKGIDRIPQASLCCHNRNASNHHAHNNSSNNNNHPQPECTWEMPHRSRGVWESIEASTASRRVSPKDNAQRGWKRSETSKLTRRTTPFNAGKQLAGASAASLQGLEGSDAPFSAFFSTAHLPCDRAGIREPHSSCRRM